MSYDPRWEQLYRIWRSDTSVRVYDTNEGDPASKADITVDGSLAASFTADGLVLSNGVAVNEFSVDTTLVGDSTSVVPTEYAVKTYVDNQFAQLTQDRIADGDSQVVVIDDSGDTTSRVNFDLDLQNVMSLTVEGLKFDFSDGSGNNQRIKEFSSDVSLGGYNSTGLGNLGSNDQVPTEYAVRYYIDNIHNQMEEPTGYVNQTSSQFGIDQTGNTATFYIEPVSGTYNLWFRGREWIKQTREEVEISDVEGIHYIYFDSNGVLSETTTFNINLIYAWPYTAVLYWDATNKEVLYLGDERHGISMDGSTHINIHEARGTLYLDGLSLTNITSDSTGGADIDAQFAITSGKILDEDISISIAAQSFPANLNMWYLDGSSANWRKEAGDNFAVINTGTGRAGWNKLSGGSWSVTEATDGYYVLTHVFATNDRNQQIVGILGQAEYSTLEAARVGASSEINTIVTSDMPFAEFVPIATLIYQTSDSFTNTPKAIIVTNDEGADWTDWRRAGLSPAAGSSTDHGSLSGLANDDHLQYAHLAGYRDFTGNQGFAAGISVTGGGIAVSSGNIVLTGGGTYQANGSASISEFSTDGTLIGNSDTALPTEQAVKTYVDTEIQDLRDELDLINIREVYSDTTAVTGDVCLVDTTAGNVTINLQEHPDGKIMIKKVTTDANSVIVTSSGLIDNLASRSFSTAYEAYTYICDGTDFHVF